MCYTISTTCVNIIYLSQFLSFCKYILTVGEIVFFDKPFFHSIIFLIHCTQSADNKLQYSNVLIPTYKNIICDNVVFFYFISAHVLEQ